MIWDYAEANVFGEAAEITKSIFIFVRSFGQLVNVQLKGVCLNLMQHLLDVKISKAHH